MTIRHLLIAALLLFGFWTCQSSQSSTGTPAGGAQPDFASILPGTWENVSLLVVVNTVANTDSSYSLVVPPGAWEQKLGIKPIQSTFTEENRYYSKYYNLQDSLIRSTRGMWNVFGDTLLLIEPEATYTYRMELLPEDQISFSALLDWDDDGQADDEYEGVQQKVK